MKPRKLKLNDAQQRWVRDWWRALQPRGDGDEPLPGELWAMGRGERAQLRRCSAADELLGHAATLLLAARLVALNKEKGPLPDDARSYERWQRSRTICVMTRAWPGMWGMAPAMIA